MIISTENWVELYSEISSYIEQKLYPDRVTHDKDGNRLDETSDDFCEICSDVEEILEKFFTEDKSDVMENVCSFLDQIEDGLDKLSAEDRKYIYHCLRLILEGELG